MRFSISWLLVAALAGSGCMSTFGERHYFRQASADGRGVNYFRVGITGFSLLSSSRYISGYFDDDALNAYFNEFTQPEKGRLQSPAQDGGTTKAVPVNGKCANCSLVMLLSSNSDEIAAQIGAFAQNKDITASLARLANRDTLVAAGQSQARLQIVKGKASQLVTLGDQLVSGLDASSTTADEADREVLDFVNALAGALGAKQSFPSFEKAQEWLQQRKALVGEGA